MASVRAPYDLTIIGGGIVGLATARQVLLRHPKLRVCVLDKEKDLATHQTMRNSGVVHCGIYYKKQSLKSKFCIKGARMVQEYCHKKGLPYNRCGKLIVATRPEELDTLHSLFKNATANKIPGVSLLNGSRVAKIQPGCTKAIEAIWSPNTAIVDWRQVALSYADDFQQKGGRVITNFTAYKFDHQDGSVLIQDINGDKVESRSVVNCAGVFSDYFARRTGNYHHPRVVPFKGNYFLLGDRLASSIKTNIYPVPNPDMPFLGVHITPRIDGSVIVGPTSIISLNYDNYGDRRFRLLHAYFILFKTGFWRMLMKKNYFMAGLDEIHKLLSKERVARDVKELLSDLNTFDLVETDFCGIRAQLVDKDGTLIDDFLFESGLKDEYIRVLHVRNCPSPAATSSLAIAERITDTLEERFL